MGQLLEDLNWVKLNLVEANEQSGKIVVRGQFARSDRATENKRLYREHLWKREIGRLNEAMQARRAFGELDHPSDGRTKLQRVSHLMTGLRVEGNEVIGEAEILDTPNGRILMALFKAGAQVGVSSRGYGSTKTISDGVEEVQEDFRLDTFDFVADPATKTAYPKVFAEEREHIHEAEKEMTLESLQRDYPGLVRVLSEQARGDVGRMLAEAEERVKARLVPSFSKELKKSILSLREDVERQVRSEIASDPRQAGAMAIVEQIVSLVAPFGTDSETRATVEAKDAEIKKLQGMLADRELEAQRYQRESEEAKALAKKAAFTLHVERTIGDHPSKDSVWTLLGDVESYESIGALNAKIEAVLRELPSKPKSDEEIERLNREIEQLRTSVQESDEKIRSAHAKRDEALRLVRESKGQIDKMEARLYAATQLAESGRQDVKRVLKLCESASSAEEVDEILESTRAPVARSYDADEADRIRARVGRGQGRDLTETVQTGPAKKRDSSEDSGLLEAIGLSDEVFDRLSGSRPQAKS